MKRLLTNVMILLLCICAAGHGARAAIVVLPAEIDTLASPSVEPADSIPEGYEMVDSVIYTVKVAEDSSLVGKSIFNVMPDAANGDKATVTLRQSSAVDNALQQHIEANRDRAIPGFRIRIYFDNKPSAREESQTTLEQFRAMHHYFPAYRSYSNPYYKVTVGDFRTKAEAARSLDDIIAEYPSAFVVKENINYPAIDTQHTYVADTVKVLRRIPVQQ